MARMRITIDADEIVTQKKDGVTTFSIGEIEQIQVVRTKDEVVLTLQRRAEDHEIRLEDSKRWDMGLEGE